METDPLLGNNSLVCDFLLETRSHGPMHCIVWLESETRDHSGFEFGTLFISSSWVVTFVQSSVNFISSGVVEEEDKFPEADSSCSCCFFFASRNAINRILLLLLADGEILFFLTTFDPKSILCVFRISFGNREVLGSVNESPGMTLVGAYAGISKSCFPSGVNKTLS